MLKYQRKQLYLFFTVNQIAYETLDQHGFKCYMSSNVSIYFSDIFELPEIAKSLPSINIWYDRGAYTALPEWLRVKYARMMKQVCIKKHKYCY